MKSAPRPDKVRTTWGAALLPALVVLSTAPAIWGQIASAPDGSRAESAHAVMSGPAVQSAEANIGPDDVLDISVFEAPEMNRTVRVSGSGEISFPLLGIVKAENLTPRQLELVLDELLRQAYMKNPHVSVFVRDMESHPVSVMGAVKKSGVFQIAEPMPLSEVLSMAEGLADDAGDTVTILHGNENARANGAGASLTTGSFPLPASRMGGENRMDPQSPPGRKVQVIRLKNLINSSDPTADVLVRPGDIVKVSRAGIVYVVGEVQRPGGFVLPNNESVSVLQAIALAQGLTHTSAKSRARIIRTYAASGKRMEIPLNLGKILAGKVPDPILDPKDIVFVPNSLAKSALFHGSEAAVITAAGLAIYRF